MDSEARGEKQPVRPSTAAVKITSFGGVIATERRSCLKIERDAGNSWKTLPPRHHRNAEQRLSAVESCQFLEESAADVFKRGSVSTHFCQLIVVERRLCLVFSCLVWSVSVKK
uniref:Uncharacterized protein n=1 Tax=Soboliphyme baturini TaxID=241478 RepID=A0A183IWM9_9BILA